MKSKLKCEKRWKIWKKGNLNTDKIWTILKYGKLNNEKNMENMEEAQDEQ